MTDVRKTLHDLASAGRTEPVPAIDVRSHVIQTLSQPRRTPPLEKIPFVFGGVAVAVATVAFIAIIPAWRSIFEPWAVYLQL